MDSFLGKTWVLETTAKESGDNITGGALCISRDGLILTVAHNVQIPNMLPEDLLFEARARASDDMEFRALTLIHASRNFDLALLRVEELEEGKEFDFYSLEDEDSVEVKINESVTAYLHQNNHFFTEKFGITCSPFPANSSNDFPDLSENTTLESAGFPDEKTRTDGPYKTLDCVANKDDHGFMDMHPKLPLVQVAEFSDEAGSSGCPFFRVDDGKLLGLCCISKQTFQYLIPVDLLKAFVQRFG